MTNKNLNQLFSSCKKWKTLVLISMLLTLGVGQMWGGGWFTDGMWQVWGYKTGYGSDGWLATNMGKNTDYNIGVITWNNHTLKGLSVNTYGSDVQYPKVYWHFPDGTESNSQISWSSGSSDKYWESKGLWNYSIDQSTPGDFTIDLYFKLYSGGSEYDEVHRKITWTIPGFTNLSTTSVTFDNTTVGSNSSKSITYTHYGTAPTKVAARYSITGTDASQFSITALSGTGATIKFSPTSAGTKTAKLVINDVHGKTTSEITLSGKTQYDVSYQKGSTSGATGSTITDHKVYGTNLTIRSSGGFSRTGYSHTAWNTNSTGTGGTSYAFGATYSTEGALTLYPTWTAKQTTVTLTKNAPAGQTVSGATSVTATYDAALPSFTVQTCTGGYALKGYYTDASGGTKIINANGSLVRNTTYATDAETPLWKSTAASLILHAQWSLDRTLTYDGNGATSGSVPATPTSYANGTNVTVLGNTNSLAKTGYSFAGWNTAENGSGTPYTASSTITMNDNYTLFAQWTENMRNVTISVSPAGAGTLDKTSASVGVATTTTVTATAQPGYRFTGWTATNCSVASSSASTTLSGDGTTGAATLVANFARTYAYLEGRMTVYNEERNSETHTASSKGGWDENSTRIAMDYDGTNHYFYRHTYKTPAELKAQISSNDQWFSIARSNASGSWSGKTTYHPSSNTDLTTAGIEQKKAAQTSTTTYNYKFNSSTTDGYAIIYFDEAGVWYELEQSLKYDANGGTGSAPATAYYLKGTNATAASNPFTARAYYTFGGWNTAQYITGTNYAAGASVTMNANTTLYAKWTRTVTLNQEDATTQGSTSVTGTYNCSTLPAITNPSKDGYDFGGWYTETAGGGSFVINTSGQLQPSKYHWTDASGRFDRTTTKDGAPLYAKWTQAVTLNANTDNHGSGSNKTATVIYKKEALSSITHCTPATGYHRVGYFTDATGGTKVLNADGSFASSAVTDYITDGKWTKAGATTLYAQYEVNTYTIHYDPNDDQYVGEATGSMDDQAATWGNYPTLTSNGFTREGYTFAGWATSPTGAVVYSNGQTLSTNLTNDNNATVTLYAKWTGRTYTVTFNARGGSSLSPASKTVTMGATYGTLATVTPPAGKVFSGWYTSAGGGTLVESTTQVTTASDHTLYAHYAEKAQVYFKNTLGWSQVWVTYDANWDGTQGTGNQGKTYHRMNLVPGTTDVYYDDIPDEYLTSWRWNIAFNNLDYSSTPFYAFDHGEAVFRYDFDKNATMFVPTSNTGTSADGNYTKNGVQYRSTGYSEESSGPKYTSGYWRTYNDTYSGYTLTYQKKGGSWSGGHKMESSNVSSNVFIYTVHMDANSQYNFAFYKERDVNTKSVQFNYRTQITSTACTDLRLVCDPNNAWMRTTVEGDYVFKLEMKNDGHMYLTVEYPFKANDYKVIYSYNKGGAKTYNSEIIRAAAGTNETISVFIHSSSDASSRSLQIAKCTGVNSSGDATWNNSYATIDIASIKESGVYNFIITQDGSAAATGAYWNKYTGNYYIRTAASDGGWDMYKYRPDNIMTLSEYSLTQTLSEPYSHYYCRFIESTDIDITYAVATDYSPNISGILVGDATIGGVNKTKLPASANVRFTYNEKTNALRRAYLKNAQGEGNTRFLVLHGKDGKIFNANGTAIAADDGQSLAANELLFSDLGNWVYQVELQAQPKAAVSLIARYNGETAAADRYLIGSATEYQQIIDGDVSTTKYDILAVYDFKTNRLMTVWVPGDGNITQSLKDVDVLLIRHGQEAGRTIVFSTGGALNTNKVIGAIEFRYNELVGHVANWNQASREKLMFDVSFPFDVNVSDIFGLNAAYGEAYAVQKYNGEERASKGFFQGDGTTTFWQTLSPSDVMKANVGYTIITDNDYFNNDVGHLWDNKSAESKIYLYFPSASNVGNIASGTKTIPVPEHECKIDRTFTSSSGRTVNHKYTDSNWNMMGVPVFANITGDASGSTYDPGKVFLISGYPGETNDFHYFYKWNTENNGYDITAGAGYEFKSMHSYMVQYAGNVTFTGTAPAPAPASVAARKAKDEHNYTIDMQLLNDADEVVTHTYVELRENACDTFALNEDVYMVPGEGDASLYSFAGNYDVAANVLSVDNQVVLLGVDVKKAGLYTFSMPSNFSGKVTLIDNFTGEHTDLSISDYEVELPKGLIDDRFMLEINIEKVTTAIDGTNGKATLKDGKAHKFLQNGILYILQNGILYDAQGKRVQ